MASEPLKGTSRMCPASCIMIIVDVDVVVISYMLACNLFKLKSASSEEIREA